MATRSSQDPVVVGADGSPGSVLAVDWAARYAVRHHAPLLCVYGHLPAVYGTTAMSVPETIERSYEVARADAERMLAQLESGVREAHPGLTQVSTRLLLDGAAAALIELSRSATATVVGARGHGGFTRLLLGSVSAQVAAHGHGTIIVVREPARAAGPIVVGVDGSQHAARALAFAAAEAIAADVDLLVIHAYTAPLHPDTTDPGREGRDAAQELLAELVEPYRSNPRLRLHTQVVATGRADQALIDASAGAALTVVGSRGRGGLASMLLGSVSRTLADHAHSPVAVIHG